MPAADAAGDPVSAYTRRLRRALASRGLDGCVLWYPGDGPGRRWSESPEIEHSEFALSGSRAWSDRPGQVPPWLIVAQTPCLRDDLAEQDAAPRHPSETPTAHVCRLGHIHHGPSPYGRGDIPGKVRRQISAALGEEPQL